MFWSSSSLAFPNGFLPLPLEEWGGSYQWLESPIRRILKVERSSRVATEENGKKEKETQLVLRHRGRRRRQEEEEAGGRRREKVEAPWESLMTFEK